MSFPNHSLRFQNWFSEDRDWSFADRPPAGFQNPNPLLKRSFKSLSPVPVADTLSFSLFISARLILGFSVNRGGVVLFCSLTFHGVFKLFFNQPLLEEGVGNI